MNMKRIRELETITNDFNSQLKFAFDLYNKKNDRKMPIMVNRTKSTSVEVSPQKKTFVCKESDTAFDDCKPWIPNDGYGKHFAKFQSLTPRNDLSPWEILRVKNMIKRSYAHQPEFLNKKDMCPSNSVGHLFEDQAKKNSNTFALSNLGKTIINKFIRDNARKERKFNRKEKQLWGYRHSKPFVEINPWKFSNHVINEFSSAPVDIAYSFRAEKKKRFLIQEPFRIPKKEGSYFASQVSNLISSKQQLSKA